MRVTLCVDALAPNPSGIGRYTWELCKALPAHPEVDGVAFYGRGGLIERPEELLMASPPLRRQPRWRKLRAWRKLSGWWQDRQLKSGLVHGPNYFLPPFADAGVITVHDLSVMRFPETHPVERIQAFEREFQASLHRATHVITDTETVRQEVIADLGVRPEAVTAVHLGVDPAFRPRTSEDLRQPLAMLGLVPGCYGMCVSTLEPRKKIAELIAVWGRLPPSLRDRFPLVLAGGGGWRNEAIMAAIEEGAAAGWLKPLGYVDETMLPLLYAGAALFVYPSLYEGFGLPLVEAMASGIPIVASNRSCLPEVGGSAPAYVDPEDFDGLLATLEQALDDDDWRQSAIKQGLARATEFSWDRCAAATVGVYQTAVTRV